MESEKKKLRKMALIDPQDYQEICVCIKALKLTEIDEKNLTEILVKRKSSVEESVLKGILKQLGYSKEEIQSILLTYFQERNHLHHSRAVNTNKW